MKLFLFKKYTLLLFILFICVSISALFFQNSIHSNILVSYQAEFSNNFINEIPNLINGNEKTAYLTFDDGPSSITPKILDILNDENIKASFFVIGKNVKQYPEIVKRAYEEGHYIANHTYSHKNYKLYKNNESFINEIKNTDIEIANSIGVNNYCSHIFRFPNGFMSFSYKGKKENTIKLLNTMDYTYIDWNCLNKDSERKFSNYQLLENLKTTSKNKGTLVVLMHDTKDVNDSSLVLQDSIKYLKNEGYTFKNFYDIL